jgi:hypothetical protein
MPNDFFAVRMSVERLITLLAGGAILASVASCGSGELSIAGKVLVDGAPMESGTLRLDPVDGASKKGAGSMVEAGNFQLPAGHGLSTGRYRVAANAFKKTGKKIQDYQRGTVEEMVPIHLRDSPKEIDLSSENGSNLTIEFHSGSKN